MYNCIEHDKNSRMKIIDAHSESFYQFRIAVTGELGVCQEEET